MYLGYERAFPVADIGWLAVILIARDSAKLESTIAEFEKLRTASDQVLEWISCDVADWKSAEPTMDRIARDKFLIMPGFGTKIVYFLSRKFRSIVDSSVERRLRKAGK